MFEQAFLMLDHVSVSLRHLSNPEFVHHAGQFVDIYVQAMCYHPGIRHTRINAWQQLTRNAGFTAICALEDRKPVGIAFGYIGNKHHWWYQQIQHGLLRSGKYGPEAKKILRHYFEIAEVHVLPSRQGRGIGRALVHALARHAESNYALLSTPEVDNENNAAFGLYRSLGFKDLLRNFYFSGDDRPFAVLWAPLPLENTSG
ncbi:GNAT family N-acetyltransferase [Corynebacterium freiburgense]|uniref:GNAT family N-acetyltransferase n=1 Tax=Corynebacterium freiburgense TaxID=556548 RepID=UPI000429EA60|nr:N-acetyltransferase [Corynebacterium freiburgense]WJZ03169.1 Mycothiol acetyltransferase [Corynebacterium freiburgense]